MLDFAGEKYTSASCKLLKKGLQRSQKIKFVTF
jgi:hypothetical protein